MNELQTKREELIKRYRKSLKRKAERLLVLEKVLREEYKLKTGKEPKEFKICSL